MELCRWWVRYLTPKGGVVLDCFSGSSTVGVAALAEGRRYIGIERDEQYQQIARERLITAESEEVRDERLAA
jgi:site-specific DNA-methyltransferase (adenine-specific)